MPSFDVVSEVNMQEVTNAVDQVCREISTRYDFKGSKSTVKLEKDGIHIVADDKMKLNALQELLKQKLAKRQVNLKSVEFGEAVAGGGDTVKQLVKVKEGLSDEELKKLGKMVKESGMKVQTQIQGAQLRVTGKKRDDLQEIIAHLKAKATDFALQFVNFRD